MGKNNSSGANADVKEKAFRFIDGQKDEMMRLWEDLVNIDGGSKLVSGVNAVARRVKEEIERGGGSARLIEFDGAGSMVLGEFALGAGAPVLLSGHMDTVFNEPGETTRRPFTVKDDKVYGPGVLDMKGGVVAAVFAAHALKEAGFGKRAVKLLFAGDEEIAHANSDAAGVFTREAKGCAAAFNCESGFVDNAVVVGRKGTATFMAAVKGVAAHAGNEPKNGRSAILEMAHKIIDIQNLTNWDKEYTFNVGVIKGGTVANAVPPNCEIEVDIRYVDPSILPELKTLVEKTLSKTYIEGTTTELVRFTPGIPPMQTTDGVTRLFNLWDKTSQENGFGVARPIKTGGGADSAYTVMAGVPTICATGVKGGRNHSADEFAVAESLFERAKLLAATIIKLDGLSI
ncbi:glutamate carboxypeptidase [Synergistales bacterium]|nr:glutamate carboxypeptidase [Synergistales bacterium]